MSDVSAWAMVSLGVVQAVLVWWLVVSTRRYAESTDKILEESQRKRYADVTPLVTGTFLGRPEKTEIEERKVNGQRLRPGKVILRVRSVGLGPAKNIAYAWGGGRPWGQEFDDEEYKVLPGKDLGPGERIDITVKDGIPMATSGVWAVEFRYADVFDHRRDCEGRPFEHQVEQEELEGWLPPSLL